MNAHQRRIARRARRPAWQTIAASINRLIHRAWVRTPATPFNERSVMALLRPKVEAAGGVIRGRPLAVIVDDIEPLGVWEPVTDQGAEFRRHAERVGLFFTDPQPTEDDRKIWRAAATCAQAGELFDRTLTDRRDRRGEAVLRGPGMAWKSSDFMAGAIQRVALGRDLQPDDVRAACRRYEASSEFSDWLKANP